GSHAGEIVDAEHALEVVTRTLDTATADAQGRNGARVTDLAATAARLLDADIAVAVDGKNDIAVNGHDVAKGVGTRTHIAARVGSGIGFLGGPSAAGQEAGLLLVIPRRAAEAGDDIFVGLARGKLREPIVQTAGIGRPAKILLVVGVDELCF